MSVFLVSNELSAKLHSNAEHVKPLSELNPTFLVCSFFIEISLDISENITEKFGAEVRFICNAYMSFNLPDAVIDIKWFLGTRPLKGIKSFRNKIHVHSVHSFKVLPENDGIYRCQVSYIHKGHHYPLMVYRNASLKAKGK